MAEQLSMQMQQKSVQTLKQLQRIIMSRQMQQAIHLLQMPVMELTPALEMELEENPVLDLVEENESEEDDDGNEEEIQESEDLDSESSLRFNDNDLEILRKLDEDFRDHFMESENFLKSRDSEEEKRQAFLESSITEEIGIFEFLMQQAKEQFEDKQQLRIAEAIIGNLDENGLFTTTTQEIASLNQCSCEAVQEVLEAIQTFDPPGIASRSLRECLLTQLELQNKEKSLAYSIIDKHFDDLVHNRIPLIKKSLHCKPEEIEQAIHQDIAKLDLHPGALMSVNTIRYIVPDITIRQEDEQLEVVVNDDSLPRLRLNSRYLHMLDDPELPIETKEFIKQKVLSAKWLLRNILQRNSTLERIAEALAKRQKEFFLHPEGKLTPLTMKMLSEELEVHESTVARAVSNKYIETPRGLFPLRFFFTSALSDEKGEEISSNTVRELLKELIEKEDKRHPLSDEALAAKMKENGVHCARRTVAKYRTILQLGSAKQRRKF